jgi:flagellar biosynthesis/type III secretory pathway M-ring protein FliF/YscJ
MSSDTPFATVTQTPSTAGVTIAVLGACIVGVIVLLVIVICLVVRLRLRHESDSEQPQDRQSSATGSLIPPVFLTEDMPNPLMQPDLCENLTRDNVLNHPLFG